MTAKCHILKNVLLLTTFLQGTTFMYIFQVIKQVQDSVKLEKYNDISLSQLLYYSVEDRAVLLIMNDGVQKMVNIYYHSINKSR